MKTCMFQNFILKDKIPEKDEIEEQEDTTIKKIWINILV